MITTLEEFTPDTIGKESAFICCDCMEAMKRMPDKCVDLAIVDPPYGIGIGSTMGVGRGGTNGHSAVTTVYSPAKSNYAKQNFITRSTTAPRRTSSIFGS